MGRRTFPAMLTLTLVGVANVYLGLLIATGSGTAALVGGFLPVGVLAAAAIIASNRAILVFGAFALDLSGIIPLRSAIIGGHVWASDFVLALALISWAVAWLVAPARRRPSWPRTPIIGWPLLLLAIFVSLGIVRGHEHWGLAYLSQPLRFVLYAAIAFAIADLTPRQAWQALVTVFYLGVVTNAGVAVYHLATGTVQQEAAATTSTGGTRVLALTTALYLTGGVVLALLNIEREQRVGRRLLHLSIGALAVFGIVVAYARGVWFTLTAVLIVLFVTRRRMRVALLTVVPFLLPLLVAGAVVLVHTSPGFVPRVVTRLTTVHGNDPSIGWRQAANRAIWDQVQDNPTFGVGFGKGATFVVDRQRWDITQDPHNSYLFLWAGGGLVTIGSFLLLYAIFLVDSWRRYRFQTELPRALIVACVAIWFCFAVDTLSSPQLTQANSLLAVWTLMLLPSVVPYARRERAPRPAYRTAPGLAAGVTPARPLT